MALQHFIWEGLDSVSEVLKIRNIGSSGSVAKIKSIHLINQNSYLNSPTLSGYNSNSNTFYRALYPFKFLPRFLSHTSGVNVGDLPMITPSSSFISALEQTPPINSPFFVSPYQNGVFDSTLNKYVYFNGEGVMAQHSSIPGPHPLPVMFYRYPIKDYYRFPNTYGLNAYNDNSDEITFKIMFNPRLGFSGLYTATFVIVYENDLGEVITRENIITCEVFDSNISEIDFTPKNNIEDINSFSLTNNAFEIW